MAPSRRADHARYMALRKATAATEAGGADGGAAGGVDALRREHARGVHLATETMRRARAAGATRTRATASRDRRPFHRVQGADRRLCHRVGGLARRGGAWAAATSRWRPTRSMCVSWNEPDDDDGANELPFGISPLLSTRARGLNVSDRRRAAHESGAARARSRGSTHVRSAGPSVLGGEDLAGLAQHPVPRDRLVFLEHGPDR